MADKILTPEETISILRERAAKDGDSFRLRIHRISGPAKTPEAVATLDEAEVLHVSSPETWLPRLCGGGPVFLLTVYHTSDPTLPIGQPIRVACQGVPREVDLSAPNKPGWSGPKVIYWPTQADRPEQIGRASCRERV